jgi:hypothetical protein
MSLALMTECFVAKMTTGNRLKWREASGRALGDAMVKKVTSVIASVMMILVLASATWAQRRGAPRFLQDEAWPFVTSERCIACHSGLTTSVGEDVSIGFNWRSSMMANSARDPYWQAAVRREVLDHPEAQTAIEDKCSTCHMPMARFRAAVSGGDGEVFANIGAGPMGAAAAFDGASCTVCHQILSENFGQAESFTGGFLIDTTRPLDERRLFGPFEVDDGRKHLMRSASRFVPEKSEHIQSAELCATCHTLYTHAMNDQGEVVGELAEQVPYLEWAHSEYRYGRSCQDCHMPIVSDSTAVASVLGDPRSDFSRHVFRGGNAFMLSMLNKYRANQGVAALPVEMDASVRRSVEHLQNSTARLRLDSLEISEGRLRLDVAIENLAGHKFPTAYPSRRAWLHLVVRDSNEMVVWESGALRPDGAIVGNDNDTDASRFEPHYTEIRQADQVQIYEPILVDWQDRVTTGLLFGVRYVKDNRLLPNGFDKTTAEDDIAVQGRAGEDADFREGGDRVRYVVDLENGVGPFTVGAELWYQTIGYRWAQNLKAYETLETERFVGYYEATAKGSAVLIARDTATLRF